MRFQQPLRAELKIIGIADLEPEFKTMKAAMLDLSAGGARFLTAAPLPEESRLLIELKFTALAKEYRTLGILVRSGQTETGHPEYCVQFSHNEKETTALTSMINQLAIKLRKTTVISQCSFCTEEDLAEFGILQAEPAR
ncbi:PilZ domain-containing protein [Paenibacillus tyrfis]|nr:PilZ domain-containing protein [Paenibacillus tyrfis]